MARQKRTVSETGRYHVLLRGMNNLFADEADYAAFMDIIAKYSRDGGFRLLSYVLLENRVHLVVDTAGGDIGKALKPVCTSYARYFNRTHGENGKLFYDRFKSEPLNSDGELKNAVAFVNFTAAMHDNVYFSAKSMDCDISNTSLTETDFVSSEIGEMFMEDYDCLSEKELGRYIFELCGVMPKDFKYLEAQRQKEAIEKLCRKRWISKQKLHRLLGVSKNVHNDKTESKNDLSVWLL